MLPDFIICGAMKCGTTSLHYMLDQHPEMCLPESKLGYNELHFFDNEENYIKGIGWYEQFFDVCRKGTLIGQTSPAYIFRSMVPKRIYKCIPEVKLIFILRDPVDRAYSQYWSKIKNGTEPEDFYTALGLESERMKRSHQDSMRYSYASRGMYIDQIELFLKCFPKEQMFFILTEDLREAGQVILKELQLFLNINPMVLPKIHTNKGSYPKMLRSRRWLNCSPLRKHFKTLVKIDRRFNSTTKRPIMDSKSIDFLSRLFNDSNKRLADLIGRDLSHWKGQSGY